MAKFKKVDMKKVHEGLLAVVQKYVPAIKSEGYSKDGARVIVEYAGKELSIRALDSYTSDDYGFTVAPRMTFYYTKKDPVGSSKTAKMQEFNRDSKYFCASYNPYGRELMITHSELLVSADDVEGMAEAFFNEFLHPKNKAKIAAFFA